MISLGFGIFHENSYFPFVIWIFRKDVTTTIEGAAMKPVSCSRIRGVCALFGIFLLATIVSQAQTTLLVNFGSDPSSNIFGLPAWKTTLVSANVEYSSEGPGGVRVVRDPDELTDYVGVQGTARMFKRGERVVVTWYNRSDDPVIFTCRISFTDNDQPDGGSGTGKWYTMRSFDDYRKTYTTIAGRGTSKTAFHIESSGVHATDSSYGLVNINLAIEWGQSDQKPSLICDKIELMSDADTQPPSAPTGLVATPLSDSKIRLDWTAPIDNTGVAEYLVYINGSVEGYRQETSYTASLLEPSRLYTFTVSALDGCRNESEHSAPATAATLSFQQGPSVINPAGFEYLGAIRFPESANWGGEMFGYNPSGDGGTTGSGAADGYPGSWFLSNINTPESGNIGEMSIPAPVKSHDVDALNECTVLQDFTNVRPANVAAWPYVDIWQGDLCAMPVPGSSQTVLYSTWAFYYQVGGDKTASLAFCDPFNLAGSTVRGAWNIGPAAGPPVDAALNDYLFSVPDAWASTNTDGKTLVTGRNREGGLSGLGPTLFAVAPVSFANPPDANADLAVTTLLQYGPVTASDNYHFPNAFTTYNHADWFRGAAWLETGNQSAVAIVGNKARGNNWYGYAGERMLHDWVTADIPYPDFYTTDPDGKGWRGHNKIPMIVLYAPEDLAQVARGTMQAYEPQPYAAVRLDTSVFFGPTRTIREAAWDGERRLFYVLEFVPELDGRPIIHTWRVTSIAAGMETPPPSKADLSIYPNPAVSDILVSTDDRRPQPLRITDLLGRTVWNGDVEGCVRIPVTGWSPGTYVIHSANRTRSFLVSR